MSEYKLVGKPTVEQILFAADVVKSVPWERAAGFYSTTVPSDSVADVEHWLRNRAKQIELAKAQEGLRDEIFAAIHAKANTGYSWAYSVVDVLRGYKLEKL
ncbi:MULTISPECIES: hypothetical protein [Mycobacteroides]|jgi:hypothetical protein|uniref:hypothetical protein n=1 Tax=Mycobacteroides TaxID=670516 RepID=UPI000927CB48|nr:MULTISPECIES: hypothetical protein [Mycobacteroides]MBV6360500.1 hypothetical protein [Mycobacteroides chelonae]SHW94930.1 Uncharacterised protein [Mycobacteroides abscessus subsp. abscessus]SKL78062.1 Uncharacterised protein [Mycobacteroides abscessus subsp. abscessus]SKM54692.1 Uncharacterised protein [Mycobacteroides abscessus subsp. abscessus]SLK35515.1 Uncharacterised protein [Mycobacteroides abscessus subsp. abscessus]